jgi:hypothetical protein
MATKVEILDNIMGSNKTNRMIEWIDANPNERYLYISPLLSEVDNTSRLATNLKHITFEFPSNEHCDTKSDDLLNKLEVGANVSCTHNLYLSMTERHLGLIEKYGYIVIIDEEVGVIDSFNKYSTDDLKYLKANGDITVSDEDGMISWVGAELGEYAKYKHFYNLCKAKAVYATKRSDTMLVTQMPVELFTKAKRLIIMTYMFKGNVLDAFLRLKKVEVTPFLDVTPTKVDKEKIRSLITLKPLDRKVSKIGMSFTAYRSLDRASLTVIENYIKNNGIAVGAKAVDTMYTFPKEVSAVDRLSGKRIAPRGYITYKTPVVDENNNIVLDFKGKQKMSMHYCWLHSTCRATNKYSYKWYLAHCYDRHPNSAVDAYLLEYGHPIDKNVFALSEMLQWIWRSRIRKGEPIVLCIASKRMHTLFTDWLNNLDN